MRFVRKPETIEAVQWTGSNWHLVLDFCGKGVVSTDGHDLFISRDFLAPGAFALPGGTLIRAGNWLVKRGDGAVRPLSFEVMADDQIRTLYEEAP